MPISVPEHSEFPKDWDNLCSNDKNEIPLRVVRSVFIASKEKIVNGLLSESLLVRFD
jgi:hypothetical protein